MTCSYQISELTVIIIITLLPLLISVIKKSSLLLLQEGNLAVGDQLLQINDESVVNLKSDEVATKLHMLERVGQAIRLVVARGDQGREGMEGASQEGTDVSSSVFYKCIQWNFLQ